MTTALQRPSPISVADYLAGEQHTDIKHEYLAGDLVAMGGASRAHGLIAGSLLTLLLPHARLKGCQLFLADMKVRIDHEGDSWFYYPDLVLSCDPADRDPLFVSNPCLLVEVLSPSTEQTDAREKLLAYRLLPGLREYLLLRQDRLEAVLYQKNTEGRWQQLRLAEPAQALPLHCLPAAPTLAEIYADVPELLA